MSSQNQCKLESVLSVQSRQGLFACRERCAELERLVASEDAASRSNLNGTLPQENGLHDADSVQAELQKLQNALGVSHQ